MPSLADLAQAIFPKEGRANVARQLQQGDPTTPAASAETIAKAWADWRMRQDIDPMNPFGMSAPGGLGAILRDAFGKPMKMYHGTPKAFEEFSQSKADPHALYGPGFYFTENPSVAAGYSLKGAPPHLTYEAKSLKEAEDYFRKAWGSIPGKVEETKPGVFHLFPYEEGANVRPAYLDLKNPFDADVATIDPKAVVDVAKNTLKAWGPSGNVNAQTLLEKASKRTTPLTYETIAEWVGKDNANQLLKRLGYDGIVHTGGKVTGGDPHKVGIAFDPKQILSPWQVPE